MSSCSDFASRRAEGYFIVQNAIYPETKAFPLGGKKAIPLQQLPSMISLCVGYVGRKDAVLSEATMAQNGGAPSHAF